VRELPDNVRRLLNGPNYCHLATLAADGAPHVTPVWVAARGGHVVFYTQTTSVKARNIDRDGRVALSILDHEDPYRSATIRGRVVARETGAEPMRTLQEMALRYTGKGYVPGAHGALFVIEPESVSYTVLPLKHRAAGGK
jgi:PPOX class probable F420-dependent enzyme